MAIVQRFQRPTVPFTRTERPAAVKPDMDKLFKSVVSATEEIVGEAAAEPARDHETACDILDRAAEAFEALTGRAQQLEADLAETEAKLAAETERCETLTRDWTRLSDNLRSHARECEQRLAEMTSRAEAAEAATSEAEARAEAAEERFTALQSRSTRLHDKVVASFGIGSRAQSLIESSRTSPLAAVG